MVDIRISIGLHARLYCRTLWNYIVQMSVLLLPITLDQHKLTAALHAANGNNLLIVDDRRRF